MNKTKPDVLRQLREADLKAANAWVAELRNLWELQSPFEGDWIEPAEIYDFGDTLVFDMKTIRYIVTNAITYDQVQDWQEYVCWAGENGFDQPSLRDYCAASVPLVPYEAQRRITDMRRDLDRLCDKERERMKLQRLDRENMTRHMNG